MSVRAVARPRITSVLALVTALGVPAVALGQRSVDLAALAAESPAAGCIGSTNTPPSVRIVACSAALDSKAISGADRAAAFVQRGQAYRAVGDETRAQADFRAAVTQFDSLTEPNRLNSEHFLQRAIARHAIGDAVRALADYDAALTQNPGNARAHLDRGILLSRDPTRLREAIAAFDRALAIVPDNVDSLLFRADAHLRLSELGAAKADAQRAATLSPNNPRTIFMRGYVAARLGENDQAFADYSEALRLDPRLTAALVNRAAILSTRGDHDAALKDAEAALKLDPDNVLAYYNRGYAHFAKHQYDEAIADYSEAVRRDHTLVWGYANRCLTRTIVGHDLADALADCDRALALQPGNLETRETRGFIFLKRGQPERALEEYDAVLLADPNRPLALFGRGMARRATGHAALGLSDERAARALLPTVGREFARYGLDVPT